MPAQQIGDGRRDALVGNRGKFHVRHHGKQRRGKMRAGAGPGRGEVELARIFLGERDQFSDRMRRYGRIHQHKIRARRNQADRRKIFFRIVGGIGIERWIDRQRARGDQERIAIGRAGAASRVPMVLPAPPRFSMTIGWPRFWLILAATRRAITSLPPPAG